MQLSKRCEYGLRALIDLGIAGEQGRPVVRLRELAAHERIPEPFLEQILIQLRQAGFLESRRGKNGGYALARPVDEIRMGDVVRLFEGQLAPIGCVSKVAYERCSCPDEDHCGLRLLMMDVRSAVVSVLDRTTLADVVGVTLRKLRRDGATHPFVSILPARSLARRTKP
jgi:Rrf2 family protein